MQLQTRIADTLRALKEPLATLAVLLLLVNLLLPVASVHAYQTICPGDGSGVSVQAVDRSGTPIPVSDRKSQCKFCPSAIDGFALSSDAKTLVEIDIITVAVLYPVSTSYRQTPAAHCYKTARAPPFV